MKENRQDTLAPMCEKALIYDMKLAVEVEELPTEFTTQDIERWMSHNEVKRVDGTPYPPISHELLANYSRFIPVTKKRKQKVLYMSPNGKLFSFNPF